MVICPTCGRQYQVPHMMAPPPMNPYQSTSYSSYSSYGAPNAVQQFAGKKIAAGICGIMLGCFGVHKFILGFNGAGAIMLSVSLIGIVTGMCLVFPVFLASAMGIVGLIEGIMYLTKSDEEFYQTYAIQRKEWF
jgi:TM2 domain-containing membrane protein YozV